MQGGISNGTLAPDLMSLPYRPSDFLLFYQRETLTDLAQSGASASARSRRQRRSSGVRKILAVAGITYDNTTLVTVAPENVINNLDGGAIDAVFRNFAPESPVLDALCEVRSTASMNFSEAEALTRIFPYLVRLVFAERRH